ncbi:aminotransferase class III-fold pyridoxal phosphate-dependent enzyme [Streptomyces sp. SID8352]|uniref:aminotransferase family protein n=1 Tax=Streptomyces sp. SID8352 TaxID=2690338 RepID=UPI001368F794|nr:aminotransferase class III-fold pyridoxal phosphate-dependent enzyme [Streptomyces sp. SID8352]MYU22598.1 aminotransferase class III-fold pyridoxal phosphate-dependent enzyme [Streptomyces sp. SID8352]
MTSRSLWNGFADMAQVQRTGMLSLDRGEGVHVWDVQGRRYLDATAGLWFANVGHGRECIAQAAAAQMTRLAAYSGFGDLTTPVATELAARLAGIAPMAQASVFFTNGGSDGVDTAVKLLLRTWTLRGQPQRRIFLSREHGYHGMHLAGTALAGIPSNRDGYGVAPIETEVVAWDSVEALRKAVGRLGAERIAGFFCEPVIGAGGVHPAPEGYLRGVRQVCGEAGIPFIADEVITGYGRIGGAWFASSRFGLEPDLVLTAKGLTSGYAPMGAVLVSPELAEPFFAGKAGAFRHGYTYGGHAAAAAAALRNLELLENEHLVDGAARLEKDLAEAFAPVADLAVVRSVRSGTGALAAVELGDPALATAALSGLREAGVLTRVIGGTALQVSPALTMTKGEVGDLAGAFTQVLTALGSGDTPGGGDLDGTAVR